MSEHLVGGGVEYLIRELRVGSCVTGDPCKVRNAESGCDCSVLADTLDRLRARVAELVALLIQVVHCGGQCSAELLATIERATQEEAGWTDRTAPR